MGAPSSNLAPDWLEEPQGWWKGGGICTEMCESSTGNYDLESVVIFPLEHGLPLNLHEEGLYPKGRERMRCTREPRQGFRV